MSETKPIPIRFSKDERRRLEEAAVIAGYKYVSAYIRDRALGREGGRDDIEGWATRQELTGRLSEIEQGQQSLQASLTLLLFLVKRRASTADISELQATIEHAAGRHVPSARLLAELDPALADLLQRFRED